MARDHARVNITIWNDPDFRKLPPAAQHLYFMLWTSPALTYAGTHDWRPGRLAKLSEGFTAAHIQAVSDCLSARYFLVIDPDTEEVLIRSWARFDGLMKQPRMAVSLASAYAAVASEIIRGVLVTEVSKIRKESPDLLCWKDRRVAEVLAHPAVSAKDLPVPEDPFGAGVGHDFGDGFALGLGQTQGKVWASVCTPPTPAPAPAPKPSVVEGGAGGDESDPARKRARQLPDNWQPNDGHISYAIDNALNLAQELEQFRDHHAAKGSTMKDWDAAFRTWLRNAVKFTRSRGETNSRPASTLPNVHDLENPPDGLSDAEYAAWAREQKARRNRG